MSLLLTLNGIRTTLADSVDSVTTTISVNEAVVPWKTPPDPSGDHYYLTLIDSSNPTKWERVQVTGRSGAGPYDLTVVRNRDSSSGAAQSFNEGAMIQWVPGGEEFAAHLPRDGSVPMIGNLDMDGQKVINPVLSGTVVSENDVNLGGNKLANAELQGHSESDGSYTLSGGTLTLDLAAGNNFNITLTENVDTIQFTNVPASGWVRSELRLVQDATGGRTIKYPSTIHWPGGSPPTHSTEANAVDFITLLKPHNNATWAGIASGVSYALVPVPTIEVLAVGSNDDPYLRFYNTADWSKLDDPSVMPSTSWSDVKAVAFSPDGSLFAAASEDTPYIFIYDTSDWSKLADPSVLPPNWGQAIAFNHNGSLVAIGHVGDPYVTIYDTSDRSKLADPSTKPASTVNGVAFSHNGAWMAVVYGGGSPGYIVYDTSDWSVADSGSLPSAGRGVTFSQNDSILVLAHNSSPYITLLDTSDWSTISEPGTNPGSEAWGVAFNHDDSLLAVAAISSPYVHIYDTSDWSKLSNPGDLPTGQAKEVAFNEDGSVLAVAHNTTPYITLYNTADWTKISNPSTLPPGNSHGVAFGTVPE